MSMVFWNGYVYCWLHLLTESRVASFMTIQWSQSWFEIAFPLHQVYCRTNMFMNSLKLPTKYHHNEICLPIKYLYTSVKGRTSEFKRFRMRYKVSMPLSHLGWVCSGIHNGFKVLEFCIPKVQKHFQKCIKWLFTRILHNYWYCLTSHHTTELWCAHQSKIGSHESQFWS